MFSFKITQAIYYRWIKKGKPSFYYKFNEILADKNNEIFKHYKGIYGYPRINITLQRLYKINVQIKKFINIWKC